MYGGCVDSLPLNSIAGFYYRNFCKKERAIRSIPMQYLQAASDQFEHIRLGWDIRIGADFRLAGGISKQNEDG